MPCHNVNHCLRGPILHSEALHGTAMFISTLQGEYAANPSKKKWYACMPACLPARCSRPEGHGHAQQQPEQHSTAPTAAIAPIASHTQPAALGSCSHTPADPALQVASAAFEFDQPAVAELLHLLVEVVEEEEVARMLARLG